MAMAGQGLRFKKAGYKNPKPLIKIDEVPMFIKASECMPKADLWIFVCQKKYLKNKDIKENLEKKNLKNNLIISIDKLTNGQAETCLLASKYLYENDEIFISSCDYYIEFDLEEYYSKIKKFDVIIFTTKCNKTHLEKINSYGWVSSKNGKINKISCKCPASNNPKSDNVIVGSFAFRKKEYFIRSVQSLIKNNLRVNNEYYMDLAVNESIKLGYSVYELLVNSYISWGTPEELKKTQNNY